MPWCSRLLYPTISSVSDDWTLCCGCCRHVMENISFCHLPNWEIVGIFSSQDYRGNWLSQEAGSIDAAGQGFAPVIIIPETNGNSLKSNFLNGLHLSTCVVDCDGRALRNGPHFLSLTSRNLIWLWRGESVTAWHGYTYHLYSKVTQGSVGTSSITPICPSSHLRSGARMCDGDLGEDISRHRDSCLRFSWGDKITCCARPPVLTSH